MNTFSLQVAPDLLLKAVQSTDAEQQFALTDSNRAYLREWLPWLDMTKAAGDTLKFVESCREQGEKKEALHCCIWFEGNLAGLISFHRFDFANRSTAMGYWLRADLQGKGIMTRSCRALIDYAFTELKMNRVEIRCATNNVKSRAIPERLGFKSEGVLRDAERLYGHFVDHVVYAMLERDWKLSTDRHG